MNVQKLMIPLLLLAMLVSCANAIEWTGTVTLTPGETFTVIPFNDETAEYQVNRTSALGALDTASRLGDFDYAIQQTDWGPFLYAIDDVAYNPDTWDSWLYQVNGVSAEVGVAGYELEDGDLIEIWYGAWGSTPETAESVVTITAEIREPEPASFSWTGTVTLTPGETFTVIPFNNETAEYQVNRTSALGALDTASHLGTFDYAIQQTDWGPFLYAIDDVAYNPDTWDSWLYQINGVSAEVGVAGYELEDGDLIELWYGAWGSTPETAESVVTITAHIPTMMPVLTLPSGTVMMDSPTVLPLSLADMTGATGFGFSINYDPASLSITNLTLNQTALPDAELTVEYHISHLMVAVTSPRLIEIPESAVIAYLTITATGHPGEMAGLQSIHAEWSDLDFNDYPISVQPGIIRQIVRGDFNKNGRIDIGDVARVAYMAADMVSVDQRADFNGDGVVDGADAALIAYAYVGKIPHL
ncbi:hypothetical protein RJ53_02565 [Methanocalculus chunghsingensis]|uniref:Transcobalamin-like C-terminal domain-containing protein n=2 Tax=Methanocalculus chunghsingensis TaxID=156457 RepID=A0A8J8B4U8_9EURY|nr:hypothetical protein [Methanocalculus chunghsingensis]